MFKNNEAPISLFSFQDVVTSLLGIMLFFLLILAINMLEMIQAYEKSSPRQDEIKEARQANRILREQISNAEKDSKRYRRMLKENNADDEAALAIRRFELEEKIKKVKQQLPAAQAAEKLASDSEKREKKRQNGFPAARENVERLERDAAEQQQIHEQQQQQLKELKNAVDERRKKINITIDSSSNKIPVLIECSSGKIVIFEKLSAKRRDIKCRGPIVADMIREAVDILKNYSKDGYYFIFLIKPDAAKYGKYLFFAVEKDLAHYECGFEPVRADEEVF